MMSSTRIMEKIQPLGNQGLRPAATFVNELLVGYGQNCLPFVSGCFLVTKRQICILAKENRQVQSLKYLLSGPFT